MTDAIWMDELEAALKVLKCKKAPGPDGISDDMLKHMGHTAKGTLLRLFNESWKTGSTMEESPHHHKKGKDKRDPKSY